MKAIAVSIAFAIGACGDAEDDAPESGAICPAPIATQPCGACMASQCPAESSACFGTDWQSGVLAGACAELLACACVDNPPPDCDSLRSDACGQCEIDVGACQQQFCAAECGVTGAGGSFGGPGFGGVGGGFGGASGMGGFATGGSSGLGGIGGASGFGGDQGFGGSAGFGGSGGTIGVGGSTGVGGTAGFGGSGGTLGVGGSVGAGGSFGCTVSGEGCFSSSECCSGFCNAGVCA